MLRAMSLRLQLLLLQAFIVCLVTVTTGLVAVSIQERVIRDQTRDRMMGVALSVARLPSVIEAFDDARPSEAIQPIAELIREASDLTYVVVTDREGIRFSHPVPSRIGERVSTDPSEPLAGRIYEGTQVGTLGVSWRVKVPIYAGGATTGDERDIIGSVSVGVLESELARALQDWLPWVIAAVAGSAIVGVFGAAGVTALVRRRIFRLEPAQIAELVKERETMLHRLSEGVVTVDAKGVITQTNDAATRLLGRDDLVGHAAANVLEPRILQILQDGEPDGQVVLAGEHAVIARGTGTVDDRGTEVGGTLLLRDHTELHAAIREMEGQNSLTDGLRAQAHEFANSMHVVSGLLELGLVEEAQDYLSRIGPGGPLAVDAGTGEVGGPLTALLSVKSVQAREQGIEMRVHTSGVVPTVLSDDLVTVLGNLVDNALEACSVGDSIAITLTADDEGVQAVVQDNGPGIPEALVPRMFEVGASTRSDGSRHRGIGLALVGRVAERRGGSIVHSRPAEGGTRFVLTLPTRQKVR